MSEEEKDMNFSERVKLYWKMNSPWGEASKLAKGIPDKRNYGPWAWVGDGMPSYYLQKGLMFMGYLLGAVMYFLNEAAINGRILLFPQELFLFNAIGLLCVGMGSIALIQFLYDSHRGTFDAFEDIWEPWRVFDLEGNFRQDVNRIEESWNVWSPAKVKEEDEKTIREEVAAL